MRRSGEPARYSVIRSRSERAFISRDPALPKAITASCPGKGAAQPLGLGQGDGPQGAHAGVRQFSEALAGLGRAHRSRT